MLWKYRNTHDSCMVGDNVDRMDGIGFGEVELANGSTLLG